MPLFSKTFFVQSYFLSCILFFAACNSPHNPDKTPITDSIQLLVLPKPGKITAQEAAGIKSACQIWYDTVLLQKGFNGGMLVAKDGNIVFEKYCGTSHLPGNDSITENTPLHIASISKTILPSLATSIPPLKPFCNKTVSYQI